LRIDFLYPDFHPGMNSTVRKGSRQVAPGDPVEMFLTGGSESVATGVVDEVRILTAGAVTDEMLKAQHSENTQTTAGLWRVMEEAYGHEFSPDEVVTIIYYRIPPSK
jgi:hypothetical protein